MPPREYLQAVGGGLIMALFWTGFVLVLTGQYREILPEPARPEYSEMDDYSAEATATKVALSTPSLAKPLGGVSSPIAQAGVTGQSRVPPSLSIFGKAGRQSTNLYDLINRNPAKQQ